MVNYKDVFEAGDIIKVHTSLGADNQYKVECSGYYIIKTEFRNQQGRLIEVISIEQLGKYEVKLGCWGNNPCSNR